MNLNTLRKNYSKLTAKERFAALVAAGVRNDDEERQALINAAPRKTYSVTHTHGLAEAFFRLSMVYQVMQLSKVGALFLAVGLDRESEELWTGLGLEARRFLENEAAWAALCAEYGILPEALLEGLPGEVYLPLAREMAALLQDDEPLQTEATLVVMREVLENLAGEWG